ncbi:MAG: PAS domain S-box protein [Leptolyngbyaceae cyanobacterium bins.349]|nr:PAS domain S-box protein [Leptolyngbyaceae cyanobacterium bins.349]
MKLSPSAKVVGIYLIAGLLWIFFSDQLVDYFLHRPLNSVTQLQTFKGWIYVIVTAVMLYWLINRETRTSRQANARLKHALAELQATQEALQHSEERFRSFMDHSPAAAWITSAAGNIEYVSQTYMGMFQVAPDLVGKSVFDLYPQAIAQTYSDNIQAVARTGEFLEAVEPGLRADGSLGQFLVYKFPLPQPDGEMSVGGVAIDITDRNQAETALQRSEEHLRLAFSFAQVGSWDWDLPNHRFTWNTIHFHLLGLDPTTTEASYENWRDRIHPDDLTQIEMALQMALEHQTPYAEEYRVIHPDGSIHWLLEKGQAIYDASGQPIRMLGVILDITDRKHTEELLRLREQQFRQAIVNAPYPMMIHAEDGEVTQINQVWTELTGYTAAEIPTIADWTEKAYGQRMGSVRTRIDRLYLLNERVYEGEFTLQTKGGAEMVWDFSSAPIGRLPDGRRLVLSMAADITRRKQLEQTLRQQAERLELVSAIAQRIRQFLNLKHILNTTVVEVKNLLHVDRVIVYQFAPDMNGTIVAESVAPGWRISLGTAIEDTCFQTGAGADYRQGKKRAIANVNAAGLTECHLELLQQFEVKANLVVPILLRESSEAPLGPPLWGLLVAHQCTAPRDWQPEQLDLLEQIALQLAIAIQQAQAFEQAQTELAERQQAERQLRAALAEKEVLLKEIHHRVKNNLQIVSGLLQLQAQNLNDTRLVQALRESQNRVESMALIHKKLYTSADLRQIDGADYIQSLAISLLTTYQVSPNQVTLKVEVEPVVFSLDQAIPCGLIINELVSNALKYAFPQDYSGEITVKLGQKSGNYELIIQDNGLGLPPDLDWRTTKSLGLSLVYALATDQLEGSLSVDCTQGTQFTIEFPQVSS